MRFEWREREFGGDKGRRREERRLGGQELFVRADRARKKSLTEGLEKKRKERL